jgi:hypothetical protein
VPTDAPDAQRLLAGEAQDSSGCAEVIGWLWAISRLKTLTRANHQVTEAMSQGRLLRPRLGDGLDQALSFRLAKKFVASSLSKLSLSDEM